jgi:hypothetical protein
MLRHAVRLATTPVVLAALGAVLGLPRFADAQTAWLLSYENKSTNQVMRDSRSARLVQTRIPSKLSVDVGAGLGGPPDPVVVEEHRYVTLAGCVAYYCPDHGWLWIDTRTGRSLGAYFEYMSGASTGEQYGELRLGSNSLTSDFPERAMRSLIAWITDYDFRVTRVTFIDRAGAILPLDAARFQSRRTFRPSKTGPSFDCKVAASVVERSICADPALSETDLDNFREYEEMRHGLATVGDQAQLRTLEQKWLADRDRRCTTAPDVETCLLDAYKAQHETLYHWKPK